MRHAQATPATTHGEALPAAAMLGALGVVYGDIGTSPLYALKEAAHAASHGSAAGVTPGAVLGVLSLILWALILVISLKYAMLILRADNRGEGGIMAMLALLQARRARPGTWRAAVLVVGLVGAALLYGDGAITPAISVLSAIEGLKVDAPALEPVVVPLTALVLIGLFLIQSKGTSFIGRIFGPFMLLWFLLLAALGLGGIALEPSVLMAVSPHHAAEFLVSAPAGVSLAVLGAVFLAVTGGEAMYADMGHFGRLPIRLAWFAVALPGLMLNYFGQAALLISQPEAIENPFFLLAPDWGHFPLVGFATLAAVIASQSIISGAFSLTRQAIQLGLCPALHVAHTASHERGQIYVPAVNWLLASATLAAVFTFRSSAALAGAYGIAVSLLMAITTLLAAAIALRWGYNPILVVAVNGFFLLVDLAFFGANSLKFLDGGWFPLVLAVVTAFLMLTWRKGLMLVQAARKHLRPPEPEFIDLLEREPPIRLPGTAAYLTASPRGIPLALSNFLRHNHALHERVLLVTAQAEEVPRVSDDQRAEVIEIAPGMTRVVLRYGFMEGPSIPEGMQLAVAQGQLCGVPLDELSYYIGRETIIPTKQISGMAVWREAVFAFMQRNAERSAAYFQIPARQVIEVGTEIEI